MNKLQTIINKSKEDTTQSDYLLEFIQYCINSRQIPSDVTLCLWERKRNKN